MAEEEKKKEEKKGLKFNKLNSDELIEYKTGSYLEVLRTIKDLNQRVDRLKLVELDVISQSLINICKNLEEINERQATR